MSESMLLLPDFIIAALATWRITHMLLHENGPFRVFRRVREALGVTYYERDSNDVASSRYEITTCLWCLSVWVGVGMTVLWLFAHAAAFWLCLPFALSACAVGLQKVTK